MRRASVLLPLGELAGVDHRQDVVQVAMRVLRLVLDRDLRGAKAVLLDLLGHQPQPGSPSDSMPALSGRQSTPASTSARKRHVAADSRCAIEVSDSRAAPI